MIGERTPQVHCSHNCRSLLQVVLNIELSCAALLWAVLYCAVLCCDVVCCASNRFQSRLILINSCCHGCNAKLISVTRFFLWFALSKRLTSALYFDPIMTMTTYNTISCTETC